MLRRVRQLGRYRLEAVQGVGAFATVWRGHDPELDALVAVKVLADNWAHDPDVRERFLEEARLLRRIADPRVVRVHDVGVHEDRPYFVMDFLTGGTVADLVGTLSSEQALAVAAESARAVQALHDHDVLHRDVKPANLLLHEGRVLVSDLGSAKRLAAASGLTVTTGTPAYMSPEQAYGEPLSARTDVYALGVVAFELLTGRQPFDGPVGRAEKIPSTDAGPSVDRAVASAVAIRPEDRPASAAAFADALEGGSPDPAPPRLAVLPVAVVMVLGFAVAAVAAYLLG